MRDESNGAARVAKRVAARRPAVRAANNDAILLGERIYYTIERVGWQVRRRRAPHHIRLRWLDGKSEGLETSRELGGGLVVLHQPLAVMFQCMEARSCEEARLSPAAAHPLAIVAGALDVLRAADEH